MTLALIGVNHKTAPIALREKIAISRDELPEVKDKVAIELMRGIKAMLDPLGIMNPGKVL